MPVTTFLLDLDNTLLANDMQVFLPAYFAGLARRLAPFTRGEDLRQLTGQAVQAMLANEDPTVTNYAVFMAEFGRQIGHPPEAILPALEDFYREDYPQLRAYTSSKPEARAVVSHLFERGDRVVIATNPFFPLPAIEQRLQWAGIDDFPYALVTTMENSHFAKPNLRYYQEILDRLGSTADDSWMVGDDPRNDIVPAGELGMKSWWISDHAPPGLEVPTATRQGHLSDFLEWLCLLK